MLRRTLLVLGVSLSLVLGLSPGSPALAAPGSLGMTQSCSANGVGVDANISWSGGNAGAMETILDVSEYNNGWVPGTYASSGSISPNINSFKWVGLLPNTVYYVRISQLMAVGLYDTSMTYTMTTGPVCYGTPTASYSTPANLGYPTGSYSTPANLGYPTTTTSYSSGSSYSGINSYSRQPVDMWVQQAIAAFYQPPFWPILINAYPNITTTYLMTP